MASKYNRTIAIALPVISFLALFYLIDLAEIKALLGNLGFGAITALAVISALRPVVGGIRSTVAYRPIAKLNMMDATKGYVLSAYGSIFLPSAIGGDLFRIEHMKNATQTTRGTSLLVAATERILGLFSLIFLTICVLFFDVPIHMPWYWVGLSVGLIGGVLLSSQFVLNSTPETSAVYRALSYARKYANSKMLASVFGLSILFQIVSLSIPVLVAYELDGIDSAKLIALMTPAIALFSTLPISLGGLGLREASYVGIGSLLGIDEGVCLISAMSLSVSVILSGIPGIFIQRELFLSGEAENE